MNAPEGAAMPRGSSKTTKFDVWSVPVTGGKPRLVLRNASFPMDHPGGPEGLQIAFVSPRPNDSAGHSIMTGREILDSDIRQRLPPPRGGGPGAPALPPRQAPTPAP